MRAAVRKRAGVLEARSVLSEAEVDDQLRIAETEMSGRQWAAALRRASAVHDSDGPRDPLMRARILFILGSCSQALSRLEAADSYYERCAEMLESAVGPADPTLLPCLLNRGCVLVRRRRFATAISALRRARSICDGLLGTPRLGLLLRSRVLLALATALEGRGETDEAEAVYRDGLLNSEEDERATGVRRRPQPCRTALAALLQARGDHEGAIRLLDVQRATLRDAQANGAASASDELAHASGRSAISAFALGRTAHGMAALREAVALQLVTANQPPELVSHAAVAPLEWLVTHLAVAAST